MSEIVNPKWSQSAISSIGSLIAGVTGLFSDPGGTFTPSAVTVDVTANGVDVAYVGLPTANVGFAWDLYQRSDGHYLFVVLNDNQSGTPAPQIVTFTMYKEVGVGYVYLPSYSSFSIYSLNGADSTVNSYTLPNVQGNAFVIDIGPNSAVSSSYVPSPALTANQPLSATDPTITNQRSPVPPRIIVPQGSNSSANTTFAEGAPTDQIQPASWNGFQASQGAALTGMTTFLSDWQTSINNGFDIVLDLGLQYAPTWYNAEQFTDYAGNLYPRPGGVSGGSNVYAWQFDAAGRALVEDYLTKLFAALNSNTVTNKYGQTVSTLSTVRAIRCGGGFNGEFHFPRHTDAGVTCTITSSYTGTQTSLTASATIPTTFGNGTTGGILQAQDGSGTCVGFVGYSGTTFNNITPLTSGANVAANATWQFLSIWAFGTAEQSGTGISSDQTACPLRGYIPFVGGGGFPQSASRDQSFWSWHLGLMSTFAKWHLSYIHSLCNQYNVAPNLHALHPDIGLRVSTVPTIPAAASTFDNFLSMSVQACHPETIMGLYGSPSSYPYGTVVPDVTWGDNLISGGISLPPWTAIDQPAALWHYNRAIDNGVANDIMFENGAGNPDWANVFSGPPWSPFNLGYNGVFGILTDPVNNAAAWQVFDQYGSAARKGTAIVPNPLAIDSVNRGKLGSTIRVSEITGQLSPVAGDLYMVLWQAQQSGVCNFISVILNSLGITLTGCALGLYDSGKASAGNATLLGSAVNDSTGVALNTQWTSTGGAAGRVSKSASLTINSGQSLYVQEGYWYYGAIVVGSASTEPQFFRNTASYAANSGLSATTTPPFAVGYTTGITSGVLPATIALSTLSVDTASQLWYMDFSIT